MDIEGILKWAKEEFETEPEYLWQKHPKYAVLRNNSSRKWYAVLMNVQRDKLGLTGEEQEDILDVKCDPILVGNLLQTDGFLPAYHMNKCSWITIRLNGKVRDGQIKALIHHSYEQTTKVKKK